MATCYLLVDSSRLSVGSDIQCGPSTSQIQFCCNSGDTCLEDSICHYTTPWAAGSGYYVGGCTDSSFPEPCSKSCTDHPTRNIVFTDPSTSLWACCYQQGGDKLDCSNPGNETFYAPSPESLTQQGVSSSTTSVSSTSTTSSITLSSTSSTSSASFTSSISSSSSISTLPPSAPSTPPPASPTPAPSSNSLSTGTKAGIGIAASFVGLGMVFALGFFFLWKRRPQRQQETRAYGSDKLVSSRSASQSQPGELNAEQQAELDGNARSELDGRS